MSYAQAEREQDQYSPEVENEASPEQGRISAFEKYGMSNSARRGRLRVGAADDGTEREADRVASAVMGGPSRLHEQDAAIKAAASESSVSQGAGVLQRSTEDGASGESFEAGSELTEDMGRSAGYQLDSSAASRIGGRLGADFSGVRIHTDRHAERVAMGMGVEQLQCCNTVFLRACYEKRYPSKNWHGISIAVYDDLLCDGRVYEHGGSLLCGISYGKI